MGIRPSELYEVEWPLAAFYLDRGLAEWANFVDRKTDEAGQAVAATMVGQSRGGQAFIDSARKAQFARLLGLSEASAYRQVNKAKKVDAKPKPRSLIQSFSGEGSFDLSKFNG